MKTLTTILMLCLPMVAMGETFVCNSTYGAAITADGLFATDIPSQAWVADTRRGLRVSNGGVLGEDYLGECEVVRIDGIAYGVWCSAEQSAINKYHIQISKLDTGQIKFLASTFLGANFSYAGTCTEI